MDHQTLVARIEERLKALKLSERKACIRADINIHTIQNIKKGHEPGADKLAALARALGVPTNYFVDEQMKLSTREKIHGGSAQLVPLSIDYIVGEVRAGAWLEAAEWPEDDWIPIAVPVDPEYERLARFGVVVVGPSMNQIYPDGTVLVCVRLIDLQREPENGERVVVYRKRPDGLIEASAKEFHHDHNGHRELVPRSTHPDHQKALVLDDGRDSENLDVEIHAVVIGSYRPEKPIRRRAR